jgi:hypothetical protein
VVREDPNETLNLTSVFSNTHQDDYMSSKDKDMVKSREVNGKGNSVNIQLVDK